MAVRVVGYHSGTPSNLPYYDLLIITIESPIPPGPDDISGIARRLGDHALWLSASVSFGLYITRPDAFRNGSPTWRAARDQDEGFDTNRPCFPPRTVSL